MTVKGPINMGHNACVNRPISLNQCLEKLKYIKILPESRLLISEFSGYNCIV